MNRLQKRLSASILSLLVVCVTILTGCLPRPGNGAATTAAPYPEESAAVYEQYEEEKLATQQKFDQLTEELFRQEVSSNQIDLHFMLKAPSSYGITTPQHLYAPITLDSMAKAQSERAELKDLLDSMDSALLTEEQKVTLRILQSFLKTEQLSDGLDLYYQPLSATIGVQAQLPILLCEYAFYQKQDVEDYLKLLAGIDDYYKEILAFEQQKADAGLMMSDTAIDHVIESCESYLLVPGDNFLIDTFNTRLEDVPGLTEEEKDAYRQQNSSLLETDFVSAYQMLIDGLTALKGTGVNEKGMCHYPDGKAYYEYLVYSQTGTSYDSVEELLKAMELTMKNSLMETSEILKAHPELIDQYETYQYRQTEPNAMMEELKALTSEQFPSLAECSYTLKTVPKALELSLSPAFYLVSPMDDYQDNIIYINHNPRFSANELYNVIAHEGYPGHLYQNVYFHTHCNSNIRKLLSFRGYSEGWASYVEHQSYLLDNGLAPEMGQMLAANSAASLGLHACLDIYINYMGWDKDQIREYLQYYYSQPDEVVDEIYSTMIENPANYLSYYVGYMEFMNMRETAERQLGIRFNAKEFHTFLLDMGEAPFDVIQAYFTSWLMKQKF